MTNSGHDTRKFTRTGSGQSLGEALARHFEPAASAHPVPATVTQSRYEPPTGATAKVQWESAPCYDVLQMLRLLS